MQIMGALRVSENRPNLCLIYTTVQAWVTTLPFCFFSDLIAIPFLLGEGKLHVFWEAIYFDDDSRKQTVVSAIIVGLQRKIISVKTARWSLILRTSTIFIGCTQKFDNFKMLLFWPKNSRDNPAILIMLCKSIKGPRKFYTFTNSDRLLERFGCTATEMEN